MRHYFIYPLIAATLCLSSPAMAQVMQQPYQQAYLLNDGQLNQLVAPIALYPDSVLSQILMASTYPTDVVEAAIWLQNSDNAYLQGDTLAAALQQQPWDPSIKALIVFPQIIQMMNTYLQWTQQLGSSVLNQQAALMDTIQILRQQAVNTGVLTSNLEQTITTQDQSIIIEATDPQTTYIPYYNPALAYGTWNYPQYPPYYLQQVNDNTGSSISYGPPIIIVRSLRNRSQSDWHNHQILLNNHHYADNNNGQPNNHETWQHNPQHSPTPRSPNTAPPNTTLPNPGITTPLQALIYQPQPVRQPVRQTQQQPNQPVVPPHNTVTLPPASTIKVPQAPAQAPATQQDPNKKNGQATQ